MRTVLILFGTRPEVVKLAPVIRGLEALDSELSVLNVASAQHTDLLYPFVRFFELRVDHDLRVMTEDQTPGGVCAKVLSSMEALLEAEEPRMIVVQGDTTTAMAGALAGFYRRIPVAHVEAGLRSGNAHSPYPEEMNRRLITQLSSYHFAATEGNRQTLLAEGVPDLRIFVTGNPVVDSLTWMLSNPRSSPDIDPIIKETKGQRMIVLTTHRRESFGRPMENNLRIVRNFVERHEDVALVFPVHPNPQVRRAAEAILAGQERIHLLPPLGYPDFISLLSHAWVIASDSGGLQEEALTLRKPLLVLRDNTERPEAIESGFARLIGNDSRRLEAALEELYRTPDWTNRIEEKPNPFGDGESGRRIASTILGILSEDSRPC